MYNANLKAHKITNIFYLIIIIPFLLLASMSALVMFNSKMAGGVPNLFGTYCVTIENNNFYDEKTGNFKEGTNQIFNATAVENIKPGDIVVAYTGEAIKTANGVAGDWKDIGNMAYYLTSLNSSNPSEVGKSDTQSEVALFKIGSKSNTVTTKDGTEYVCFTYYTSNNSSEVFATDGLVLYAVNIIGVAPAENNQFVANYLMYASTDSSLLTLVLLPCVLLIILKIISCELYRKYSIHASAAKTAQIVTNEEGDTYTQVINVSGVGRGAPKRPQRQSAQQNNIPNLPARPKMPQQQEKLKSSEENSTRIANKIKKQNEE